MSEPTTGPAEGVPVRETFEALAARLREADHLGPEAQAALSELLQELARAVDPAALRSAEAVHLAESAAHLVEALHRPHQAGLLGRAKSRLEEAARRAEAEAPVLTGLVGRLIDTLANLGI